jgi:hypothetical protein
MRHYKTQSSKIEEKLERSIADVIFEITYSINFLFHVLMGRPTKKLPINPNGN